MGWRIVKVTADTNVLVRAATGDDPEQAEAARNALAMAEVVAITLPALCEFCWVLKTAYGFKSHQLAASLSLLAASENVVIDRDAVEAGIAVLALGGDFADGVIAHEGRWLGGETFVTFDKQAAQIIASQDGSVKLLTAAA